MVDTDFTSTLRFRNNVISRNRIYVYEGRFVTPIDLIEKSTNGNTAREIIPASQSVFVDKNYDIFP